MSKLEKSIHEVLSRMTSQLVADERKVDSNAANLGQVWEKVDLVMITITPLPPPGYRPPRHAHVNSMPSQPQFSVPDVLQTELDRTDGRCS
jgi:hypothetical protein